MKKITLGLVGFGTVGSGVVKFLQDRRSFIRDRFGIDFFLKSICDRSIDKKINKTIEKCSLTTQWEELVKDPMIDVIVELIGGVNPAKEIVVNALRKKKHVVTANKELIASLGQKLFEEAHQNGRNIYYESSVMAGVPIIRTLTEGIVGNRVKGLYGIINGTCNYILTEMTDKGYSFEHALADAKNYGYAESDPTLDINGMDATYKLAILVNLAMGKFISVKDIHTEGIAHIAHDDIEHAESLGLNIKLLAIAKQHGQEIEARVHPTLIPKDHPLAIIDGVDNAIFVETDPLGDIFLAGQGAGKMSAASGVISDLLNIAVNEGSDARSNLANLAHDTADLRMRMIDDIMTKFYIRIMAIDKPGVLSQITGILGQHEIGINSFTQKAHNRASTVPVIMLTEPAPEKKVRLALEQLHKLPVVKSKPVAIRMENP